MGKILEVDLTTRKIIETPTEEIASLRQVIGGKNLGLEIIWSDLKEWEDRGQSAKEIDPFGPENTVVFATGPGTGIVGFPSSGRYHVMATRSPLTGGIGSANSGGDWGPFLKFAGYDAVVIRGKSTRPVVLVVTEQEQKLIDGGDVWHKNVFDTIHTLQSQYGDRSRVACIGPAGENQVLFANIMNEHHRAAGRTGLGAVLGSKKLKAIVVAGTKKVEVADREAFKEVATGCLQKLKKDNVTGEGLPTFGTGVLVNVINEQGALPTWNFQDAQFPYAESISAETMNKSGIFKEKGFGWVS